VRAAAPGRRLSIGELELHVVEHGAPDAPLTLLLLHGYLAAAHIWEPAATHLVKRGGLRVLALDLPGAGYSARPRDRSYSLEWLASVTFEAMRALELERPLLGGHSLGGAVALHVAARSHADLSGLVLCSPLCFSTPLPSLLRPAARWPGPFQLFYRSPLGRRLVRPALRRNFAGAPSAEVERSLSLVLEHLDVPGGWRAATRMGVRAAFRRDMTPLLDRVRVPALLLWGPHDRVHPPQLGERLATALPHASQVLLEGCGHNPHLEHPERFAEAVADWIEAQAQSTSSA